MKKSLWMLGLGTALVLPVAGFGEADPVPSVEIVKPKAEVNEIPAAVDEKVPLEMSSKPLTPESQVVAARLPDLFRFVFASCRADIDELKAVQNPTPAQTKKLAAKEKEMKDLAVLFDEAVNIAPIVTTLSIQFGAEIPSRFIPAAKWGQPGAQFSGGVTLAVVKHELTGNPALAIGISQIAGVNFTVGKRQHDKLRPSSGVTYLVPALAITVPLVENVPSTKMGDLQGWYWGAAGEISSPASDNGRVSRTGSIGFYAKLQPALKLPESAMVFIFHGVGGETAPPAGQLEALAYNVWVASDKSTFRLPLPLLYNNASSEHANHAQFQSQVANREKMHTLNADDLAKKIAEIQEVLEKTTK